MVHTFRLPTSRPQRLVATPLAGAGIQLAWVDNSATSTGFTVSRSPETN